MKKNRHFIHDSGYKRLFSNPELVKQLLLSFVDETWVNDIDYSRLERVDKSFITDEFARRESDMIYRTYYKDRNSIYSYCWNFSQQLIDL